MNTTACSPAAHHVHAHRAQVVITASRGYGDCEDCGMFDWGHATVEVDGRELQAHHDGHLGGGNWQGDTETLQLWALQMLGVTVRVNGEADVREPPFYERKSGGDWEHVVLLPENPQVVDILLENAPDPADPEYEYPARASWRAADGSTRELLAVQGWEGTLKEVYAALISERADVELVETQETDD